MALSLPLAGPHDVARLEYMGDICVHPNHHVVGKEGELTKKFGAQIWAGGQVKATGGS